VNFFDTLLRIGRPISSLFVRPFFLLVLAAGCAAPGDPGQPLAVSGSGRQHVELDSTPFFPQAAYQCGPAALAMVLTAAGRETLPDDITAQVYIPGRKGSLQAEMLTAARRHGMVSYVIDPDIAALQREIDAGNPVLVLQNLGLDRLPSWHYAVVIGYDLGRQQILLRSGRTERLEMPASRFDQTWRRGARWAMITLPPGRLPAGAERDRYIDAVIAFSRVAEPQDALTAYLAAADRWPDSALAWMGAGTSAYALKSWEASEAAFREAAVHAADRAPALNNLALALDAQGRRDEAVQAARAAVAAGGPFSTIAQATLADLLNTTEPSK
jgi:hypothetical protein